MLAITASRAFRKIAVILALQPKSLTTLAFPSCDFAKIWLVDAVSTVRLTPFVCVPFCPFRGIHIRGRIVAKLAGACI